MRTLRGLAALALVTAIAAACAGTAATASPSAAPSAAPSVAATATPTPAPTPTPDACAPTNLKLRTAGVLTIGADNPPYFVPSSPNPSPWELGDPTNKQGFEDAVAYAVAGALGFTPDKVTWQVEQFNNATAAGPKDFDFYIQEVSYTADRTQAVDLSDGYYFVNQSLVALKANKVATVTSLAALKAFQFGAQVGTTSLDTINTGIAPAKSAKVYDTNDAAVEALKNGQIDGIVVDLPTAFYMTSPGGQIADSLIVGQFTGASKEHFSLVLDKGSSLTACVNAALAKITADGSLAQITQQWLADKADAPVFQP